MAIKIDEQRMVSDAALNYEKRVHSPIRRFTDKPFTPTRYWHIKGNQSKMGRGYKDVASVVGPNSPIRFSMIENLPLCGIETIHPQTENGDMGLDTRFESEAVTMDNTIRPYENDFFMITYLKEPFIFRVTSVESDTISSDKTYKIQYALEYIDPEKVEELMRQTVSEYICILENIGTDERCIVEKSEMNVINKVDAMYDQMAETYITFYYNRRYNCFLGDFENGKRIYDPLQEVFINKHKLFSRKNQIDGLVLTEQFNDPSRAIKYQRSMYRYIELKRDCYLSNFSYTVFDGRTNPQTSFHRWMDSSIVILDIPKVNMPVYPRYSIFTDDFIDTIKSDSPAESIYADIIRKFVQNEELVPADIDLELNNAILDMDSANLEVFFLTPIIMYIIKTVLHESLSRERRTDVVNHFI